MELQLYLFSLCQLNETFVEDLGIAWSFHSKNKSNTQIFKHKQYAQKNKCNLTCYKVYSKESIDSQSPNGEGVRNA